MGSLGHGGGQHPQSPTAPHLVGRIGRLQVKVADESVTLGVTELTSSATFGLYSSSRTLPGREGYFLIWKQ